MKTIALILSLLLLTSCSNPDTSGGVTLSRGGGGDWDNTFPNGSCKGPDQFDNRGSKTGCGWISANGKTHYIMPLAKLKYANLRGAELNGAKLNGAYLNDADLRGAWLIGAKLNDADLKYAVLWDANLRGAFLNDADLLEADLRDAFLVAAELWWARLWDANLSGADLRGAFLTGADLGGANKTGVKADRLTRCPNGHRWGTAGNDCGF